MTWTAKRQALCSPSIPLTPAKKLIKENMDKYIDSIITKTWANGDWENLGPIKLSGNNKTFVANTRQKVANY